MNPNSARAQKSPVLSILSDFFGQRLNYIKLSSQRTGLEEFVGKYNVLFYYSSKNYRSASTSVGKIILEEHL